MRRSIEKPAPETGFARCFALGFLWSRRDPASQEQLAPPFLQGKGPIPSGIFSVMYELMNLWHSS